MNKNIKDYELPRPSYMSEDETYNPLIVQRLLVNGMRTPDGTEIYSRSRHDYVTHDDKNGQHYMVDGGLEYERRSINEEPAESLSVYVDEDHAINRQHLTWGTYGKGGDQPLAWKKLQELDTSHINAILETQKHLPEWKRDIFKEEILYRCNQGVDDGDLNNELASLAAEKEIPLDALHSAMGGKDEG